MNKQQALKELTELRERADALEAIINQPESYGRKRVEACQRYFYMYTDGVIDSTTDSWTNISDQRFTIGNYYYTQEEAEKARDRQLAYVRITDAIREQNKGWVPDWSDVDQMKYSVCFDYAQNDVDYTATSEAQDSPDEMYGTLDAIVYVIKHHADDIKLYLGVE